MGGPLRASFPRHPLLELLSGGQAKHEGVASGARAVLLSRLERQPVINAGHWTRDELYEDER